MSQSSVPPPSALPAAHAIPTDTCQACGQAVDFRAAACPRCGFPRGGGGVSSFAGPAKAAKSPRSAVWLSLTWPGSGHVYAGITEKGAILCGVAAVLFALSLALIGPVLGLVLWLGLSLYAALDVSSALTS